MGLPDLDEHLLVEVVEVRVVIRVGAPTLYRMGWWASRMARKSFICLISPRKIHILTLPERKSQRVEYQFNEKFIGRL